MEIATQTKRFKIGLLAVAGFGLAYALDASAQDEGAQALFIVHNMWMLLSCFLVFVMHLGFACLEAGLTRAKNTVNILFKNTAIIAIGLLTYALCGFNLMYPGEFMAASWLGFDGFWIAPGAEGQTAAYAEGHYTYYTDYLFQAMFAATAATIVSGAVAERIKLESFLLFSVIYVAIAYPIAGSWTWGGGWLSRMGFYDFADSTIVHSAGGWAALAGVLLLGPRTGKYVGGRSMPLEGHSMPLATIGVFLLWFGWFGFNGGSVLSADPDAISLVVVTTSLAAAAGVIGAMAATRGFEDKLDLSMVLNGALAGLVGITAGADSVSPAIATLIGFIAGALVVASVLLLDRLRLDDPVGAISVHLVCGIWGTIAVGLFSASASVTTQLIGIAAYGVYCLAWAFLIFGLLKYTLGIRVTESEELRGLDIDEHGMEAYGGFQIFLNR